MRWLDCLMVTCLLFVGVRETKQNLNDNEVDDEDSNPFMEMASAFIQNAQGMQGGEGLGQLGSLVGTLMQGDAGKQLGEMFLGGGKSGGAGDVLSSLSGLLTNSEGKFDPSVIGSMVTMFAQQAGSQHRSKSRAGQDGTPDLDIGNFMNVASSFLGSGQAGGNQQQGNPMELLNMVPMLLNTLQSFTGPEAENRAHDHADHAWFLPPVLENLHLAWDHFINSELGVTLYRTSGLEKVMKIFRGPDGNINYEFLLDSMENLSFRRRWIRQATGFLTEWAVHLAKPEVHTRYIASARRIINAVFQNQGFPKEAQFDSKRPADSINAAVNHLMVRYFDARYDVSIYVKPAIAYLSQIMKMAQKQGDYLSRADHNALSDKITDMFNLELIEPVLRVYRAYRHAKKAPHCQAHLMCLVNRHDPKEKALGIPGFKQGLTKLSSLVASAALSYHGGNGFWDLYNAVLQDIDCQAKYPADCSDFHYDESKVTTEYYHNEL